MRESQLYDIGVYGVVAPQFLVGGLYLGAQLGVVPMSPLVAMLALAHLAGPAVVVVARTFDEGVEDQLREHYTLPGTADPGEDPGEGDTAVHGETTKDAALARVRLPPGRNRRVLLFALGTLGMSLVGAAVAYPP